MKNHCIAILVAIGLAIGTNTAYAQTVNLDNAIQNAAAELSPNIRIETSVAVIAIQADSVGMSNHLINGMIAALFGMRSTHGFEIASRGQIEMLMAEQELSMSGLIDDASAVSIGRLAGVQYIMTGTFAPTGDIYRFWAQLIEVETGFFRGTSTVDVLNDSVVASLLGAAGRTAPPSTPAARRDTRDPGGPRANWLSGEVSLFGVGIRYERDINSFFSVGGAFFYTMEFGSTLHHAVGASVNARLFLGNLPIYLEMGMGWGTISSMAEKRLGREERFWASGFMINPALGARLVGQRGRFFVNPFINLPTVFGESRWDWDEGGPPPPQGRVTRVRAGVGLGGAW